jgi:hypothetical protein
MKQFTRSTLDIYRVAWRCEVLKIQAGAKRLNKHLKKTENFSASSGWLWRFRNSRGVRKERIFGEAPSSDTEIFESLRYN